MSEQTRPTSQTSSALRPVHPSRHQDILYFSFFVMLPNGEPFRDQVSAVSPDNILVEADPPSIQGGFPLLGGGAGPLGLRAYSTPPSSTIPSVPLYKTSSIPPSSDHVGVLVLQLVQLFALLPQEQDPG